MRASNRVALITGASSGVGLGITEVLVAQEWQVVGISRSATKLANIGDQLGPAFEGRAVDVTSYGEVSDLFQELRDRGVQIDLLVNSAAVFEHRRFVELSHVDIDRIVDTNLKGTMYCCHVGLPLMTRPGGRIVNIASVAATHGIKNQAAYCASKYGVDGFADALGQELADEGIGVTTIFPGAIDTALWNEANPYIGGSSAMLQPRDIAHMVEYIATLPSRIACKQVVMFPTDEWH